MTRRRFYVLLGMMIALLVLSGCGSTPPGPTPQPSTDEAPSTDGGTTSGETTTGDTTGETTGGTTDGGDQMGDTVPSTILLDPAQASDKAAMHVNDLLYDGLVAIDENGEPVGALASSWVVSEDGLQYTFNLRPGVTFSDGSALDADTVIANFNRWFDPASNLRGSGDYAAWQEAFLGFRGEKRDDDTPKSTFDGIEKVDTLTVIIHLNTPDADLLTKLAQVQFGMVGNTALEANAGSYGAAGSELGASGAYILEIWDDTSLVLAPNTLYYGEPATETVTFNID